MNRKFIVNINRRRRYRELSDEELILEYAAHGQNEILDEFFDRYVHLIYAVCMKYFQDEEKAKDTTMIIFENLGSKIKKFVIQHFTSWLYTVTRNACLMELRKKKYEIPLGSTEIIQLNRMENSESEHLFGEEKVNENSLMIYLQKLNNNQRLCLDMMYFQKKSYKDIAAQTGLSIKEVKSHIQNGKRNLKNLMNSTDEEKIER